MSLKQIDQIFKQEQDGGCKRNDQTYANSSTKTTMDKRTAVDSDTALKKFLDSIPISSIPNIQNKNFHVVQLKMEDTLKDAIKMMLDKNVYGAPIVDAIATKKASNRYIGFLSFSTTVFWCIEEMEKKGCFDEDEGMLNNGFFSLLEQNPSVGQTKVRELAKSFFWEPFFPMNLEDDTLFRALLLFSKHRVHVLPVTNKTNTEITGFITQNMLLELLLQSRGLEWFDKIADSPLAEFRFNNEENAPLMYADQSVLYGLRILWKNKASVVAVVEHGSKELIGNFRSFDIHLLVDNDELFTKIRNTTMSEFIQLKTASKDNAYTNPTTSERNPDEFISTGDLCLRNNCLATMASPVTHKMTHTLEQAMTTMVETRTETSFLIESESNQIMRALTSRNIIMEFAPPGIDTRLRGGGFFETALEQTGCHLEKGTLFHDH